MKVFLPTAQTVKGVGRTVWKDNALWLIHSAASISFYVEAKRLSITLVGDGVSSKRENGKPPLSAARYALYINDDVCKTGTIDALEKLELVFESAVPLRQKISLVKLTESSQSYFAVKSLTTDDGGTLCPAEERPRKIEFVGDSITCGYGVDSADIDEPFCTATEDATKTYAYLTAEALGADCAITAYSSFGVVSGWTDSGEKNDFSLVPRLYDNAAFSWNTPLLDGELWDFMRFCPQVVVVNLGTNDISYCKPGCGHYGERGELDLERCAEFVQAYRAFLSHIRRRNPAALIVCAIGIMRMGDEMAPFVQEAAERYRREAHDERVVYFHFNPQTAEEGFGSGQHPTFATQRRCAQELIQFLSGMLMYGQR